MANRYTDTEKWDDPWFSDLSVEDKLFWIYLCDNCDQAGIWKVNWKLVKYNFGNDFEFNADKFKDRITVLSEEKWFIKKFVLFQQKIHDLDQLNPMNKCHASIISILSREGLGKPLPSPLEGAGKGLGNSKVIVRSGKVLDTSNIDTDNRPQKRPYVDFDKLIEDSLGKIASKDAIKVIMLQMPDSLWWKVDTFLRKRYPGGGNGFLLAQAEIVREGHFVSDKIKDLVKDVGKIPVESES